MKTTLKIEGMSCEHCARHVQEALEGIKGVMSARVTLNTGSADVTHDEHVSLALMEQAVTEAGYKAV
ncbi:MAG: heavy-metal-associated domain-containing protein [Treponema sp.]|nr:heavy-metal-associated domain-containing protein [Treponema sp.]